MASLVWLTSGTEGNVIDNFELFASHMIIPIAIKHFNTRNGSIVPQLAQLGTCNSTINLVGGLQDSRGQSGTAVEQLLDAYNNLKVDVIHGPSISTVSPLEELMCLLLHKG